MSHSLGIHSGAAAPTQGFRASRRVSRARAPQGLSVTAQAANSPHNHRAVSPAKPRPGSVLAQPKTVTQSDTAVNATATGSTGALSASGSDSPARGRTSVTFSNAAVNSAGFQRTSWYGAVDNRSAVGASSLAQDGALTPGRRNLRAIRPITQRAGSSSASSPASRRPRRPPTPRSLRPPQSQPRRRRRRGARRSSGSRGRARRATSSPCRLRGTRRRRTARWTQRRSPRSPGS